MGLIDEYVNICNVKRNRDFYFGKYEIVDDSYIKIRIDDLYENSHTIVDVKCDKCFKILKKEYRFYNKSNIDGQYYCSDCLKRIKHENSNPKIKLNNRNTQYFSANVLFNYNYECFICNSKSNLVAHHLNGYNWDIENRNNPLNGVCLCNKCHTSFHSLYGKGNNTKEQFYEWCSKNTLTTIENVEYQKIYCYELDKIFDNATECRKYFNIIASNSIHDCCKTNMITPCSNTIQYLVKDTHLFYYDYFVTLSNEQIEEIINRKWRGFNKVVCLTTGDIYESLHSASESTGVSENSIRDCINKKYKSGGKYNDNIKYVWMKYDEYIKYGYTKNSIEDFLKRKFICLNDNKIFDSAKEAADYYNINRKSILACCNNISKYGGKVGNERLLWSFYYDYNDVPDRIKEIYLYDH